MIDSNEGSSGTRRERRFDTPGWRLTIRTADGRLHDLSSANMAPVESGDVRVWAGVCDEVAVGVTVRMTRIPKVVGAGWRLSVENSGVAALWEVAFPDFHSEAYDDDTVLLPNVSGKLHPASEPLEYVSQDQQHYPSGALSMQCLALYGPAGGVYVAAHDPHASRKRLEVISKDGRFEVRWHWPVPDMGKPGTSWELPGEVVIRPFEGDWFDVAQIYRAWVSKHAEWWPRGGQAGRPDTPAWFKDSPVWMVSNGPWPYREPPIPIEQATAKIKKFAAYMDDLPCAVHWYNWHQVPYDTESPHYFPAKEGFAEAVREVQDLGVRVMPYINAHVWDMATEEFEAVARPAAVKSEDGSIPTKEYAGNTFAPMCPTTPLWRNKVKYLVERLTGSEIDADGVYLDQISAQNSELCFDEEHGHPLGGGSWWTAAGNWPLLDELNAAVPDAVLTSESAAEPYVNRIDGYLTWGGFRNGDRGVPLFHAVYAGQVQLFGRLYKMDTWKGVAMHTKAAQALVWGEQIGWITPDVVDNPVDAAFLKRLARARRHLGAYLAHGRMARPPRLETDGSTLTTNWVFATDVVATIPTVIAGAWHHERDGAVALILVNNDAQAVHTIRLPFSAATYGLKGTLTVREWVATEQPEDLPAPTAIDTDWTRELELAPLEVRVFEVREN